MLFLGNAFSLGGKTCTLKIRRLYFKSRLCYLLLHMQPWNSPWGSSNFILLTYQLEIIVSTLLDYSREEFKCGRHFTKSRIHTNTQENINFFHFRSKSHIMILYPPTRQNLFWRRILKIISARGINSITG